MGARHTMWQRNRLVLRDTRLRHPWALLFAGAVVVAAVDAALWAGAPANRELALEDRASLRAVLGAAAGDDGRPWLLVGDSVLYGDSIAAEVPDWAEHRVLDYLRQHTARDAADRFHQAALNGLLLPDMIAILGELNRLDPGGQVGVVLEINLRYFSPHYASQGQCSRPWLDDLRPAAGPDDATAWIDPFPALGSAADALRNYAPIFRHRWAMPALLSQARLVPLVMAAEEAQAPDPMEILARSYEHFRTPLLTGGFAPEEAFRTLLGLLRASGRRALLFTPPLNDEHTGQFTTARRLGEDLGLLARMVDEAGGAQVRLTHFDHPQFRPEHFKDVAHLFPEGNELLALNLLSELGVRMAEAPPPATLIYPQGPDAALIWNLQPGDCEGAPWMAQLANPGSVAVTGPGRVYVADTGNHCVRALDASGRTVYTLAGKGGEGGYVDGPWQEARLEYPALVAASPQGVFVADGAGRTRLRLIQGGRVRTELPAQGPGWRRIDALCWQGHQLYLLDEGARVLAYAPETGVSSVIFEGAYPGSLTAFDVARDGRMFLTGPDGRIWGGHVREPRFQLLFRNEARELYPRWGYFPFDFGEMRLQQIIDLRFIPQYNGLLIQERVTPRRAVYGFNETVQLRFLDLSTRKIYPWINATVQGEYITWNSRSESAVSQFREGALCVRPDTAMLYYLERDRPRLFAIEDGLLETSKVSHIDYPDAGEGVPELFEHEAGSTAYFEKRPDQFLHKACRREGLEGPYIGLIIGPSTIASAELSPRYSLGRRLEEVFARRLRLEERLRFDALVRTRGGMSIEEAVGEFTAFQDMGGRADLVLMAVIDFATSETAEIAAQAFAELAQAAQRFETEVIFFDDRALFGKHKDALRAAPASFEETKALIRAAGFRVIEPGASLVRDATSVHPWGNPPFEGHHGAPWAIEVVAEHLTAQLYPAIRAHLRGRQPALLRLDAAASEALSPTLSEALPSDLKALAEKFPPVPERALQRRRQGAEMQVLLDLSKAGTYVSGDSAAEIRTLALATVLQLLRDDPAARLSRVLRLRIARFSNYDEYGAGVGKSAEILLDLYLDAASLAGYIAESLQPSESSPLEKDAV